jgi:O-acetyl-ADP-ribose deacetylase (regulator of RNase III)
MMIKEKNMSSIKLIQASAVEQNVDAIVNAANKYLAAGGGICGAIFSKAGHAQLQNACEQYTVPLKDGEAVITPAFNIENAKCIIHAVGPNFSVTPKAFKELCDAYYNSLKVLMENNLHSIAFPLISSGIFGGNLENPVAVSVKECVKAYGYFTKNHPDYNVDVLLCVYSAIEYNNALKAFEG